MAKRRAERPEEGGKRGRQFPAPTGDRVRPQDVYRDHASTRWFMQHVRQVVGTADLRGPVQAASRLPHKIRDLGMLRVADKEGRGRTLEDVLRATDADAFVVLHDGAIVHEKYFGKMTAETPHLWQSGSKSLMACVAGSLIADRRLGADDRVGSHVPELDGSAYGDATVRDLLDMRVGVEYSEDYTDPDSDVNELDRIYGLRPPRGRRHPGSSYDFATTRRKRGEHGVAFEYVSLNVNVLAWVLERASGTWLPQLIRDEVWGKLGAEHDAYISLDAAGSAQAESGMCSSLRDLARLGLALSRRGELGGRQVVPAEWVDDITNGGDHAAFAAAKEASVLPDGSYRNNFWVARSGDEAAFLASGIYGQTLYVNPAAGVVVAKFSTQAAADDSEAFRLEFALCEALAESL